MSRRNRKRNRAALACPKASARGTPAIPNEQDTPSLINIPPATNSSPKKAGHPLGTIIVSVMTIAGFLLTMYQLRTIISAAPGVTLDPSDIHSTSFTVSNDGLLSLRDVQVGCVNHVLEFSAPVPAGIDPRLPIYIPDIKNIRYEKAEDLVMPGEKLTVRCEQTLFAAMGPPDDKNSNATIWITNTTDEARSKGILLPVGRADATLSLRYRIPFSWFHSTKQFRFIGRVVHGQVYWDPQPLSHVTK